MALALPQFMCHTTEIRCTQVARAEQLRTLRHALIASPKIISTVWFLETKRSTNHKVSHMDHRFLFVCYNILLNGSHHSYKIQGFFYRIYNVQSFPDLKIQG